MERTSLVLTFSLAVLAAALLNGLIPAGPSSGLPEKTFWNLKKSWHQEFDAVVTGDSRVARGVAPEVFGEDLGIRLANLGWDSAGYTERYLQNAEDVLAPEGARMILLGITPWALTPRAIERSRFESHRGKLTNPSLAVPWAIWGQRYFPFHGPTEYRSWIAKLTGRPGSFPVVKRFHQDGWVSSDADPLRELEAAKLYSDHFKPANTLSSKMVATLLSYVQRWSDAGIRVHGFRLPGHQSLYEVEERASGFEQADFVVEFEKAGGRWIRTDPVGYQTYDGSHLRRAEAIRFSRALSKAIRQSPSERG